MTSEQMVAILNDDEFRTMLRATVDAAIAVNVTAIERRFNERINGLDSIAIQTEVARRFNALTTEIDTQLKGFAARVAMVEKANPDKGTTDRAIHALADLAAFLREDSR